MDFVYEAETLSSQSPADTGNVGVSLNLSSISTADFTKKLQSLSILNRGNSEVQNQNVSETERNNNLQSIKMAKITIELLESLGFDYNPYNDSIKRNSANLNSNSNLNLTLDPDELSNIDSKELIDKYTKILENTDGYDLSIKQSLTALEKRINYYNHDKENNLVNPSSNYQNFDNLTSIGHIGDLTRRNLRGLIENDLLHQYNLQLKQFQKISKSIESIRPSIFNVIEEYNNLSNNVNNQFQQTTKLNIEINELNKSKRIIELKKNLLLSFKSNFTLNHYEIHLVNFADLNDSITGKDFFTTIEKIKKIQNNCDILLSMDNERLGLKIMKQMNDLLILANERINYYVKNNIELVYNQSTLQNSKFDKKFDSEIFQKSLIYLWNNDKSNFNLIISNMVETRSRFISNEFINQLKGYSDEIDTSINANLSSNLIIDKKSKSTLFLSSYDTIRFISDTLAYIHNILVNEMENARSFLTFNFLKREESNEFNEFENLVIDIVINIISGLNKPLKGAIENILRQESKLSTLVNSYDLLLLYSSMFKKLLYQKDKITLLDTMLELSIETQDRVFSLIKIKLKSLESDALEESQSILDKDDVLPDWIVDWCAFIDELFDTNSSTIDGDSNLLGLKDDKWNELINLLINKPIDIINNLQSNLKIDKKDKLIWKLNCIDYMFNKFDINPLLSNKSNILQKIIEDECNELIDLEFDNLLKNSGLYDIYNLINMIFKLDDEFFDISLYQPITENKLFNVETFQIANTKLEAFFSSYINQNELDNLMSPKLFNKVFFESSMKFIKFYSKLVQILNEYLKIDSNDAEPVKVFTYDELSIATLLGIEQYFQEHQANYVADSS